ncbi:MAG: sigma-70 family RNA polymerase sigma factor [Planctomycetia bacterium]|nr:sigma-70 family RNA polymerase sigma factor [Planctomycetia bacterium]
MAARPPPSGGRNDPAAGGPPGLASRTPDRSLASTPPTSVAPGALPLGEHHRAWVADHGDLGLSLADYERRVATLATRHWERQGLEPTPARVAEHLAGAALADLYLACAADAGSERAWTVLSDRYRTRLEGFAVRRGLSSEAAVATVQDVLGDLALPPSNGAARTVLGTYDGTGNLFSWLSIVLVRRIAGDARRKKPASLDADPDGGGHPERTPSGRVVVEPAHLVATDESRARFAAALERAWQGLSSQERLALVAKHRDGWSQRQVGALLGLGEARVSRIVSAAVEKLRGPLRDAVGDADATGEAALAGEIATFLARTGPLAPPSGGGPRSGPVGAGGRGPNPPP